MQRYWPSASTSSSSSGTSSSSASAGGNAIIREQIQKLSRKTLDHEEITDEEVSHITELILDSNNAGLLKDLLFVRTVKPGTNQTYTGLQGISLLKAENRQERCGKLFVDGDLAYNCRTCQVDATCVICQDCFDNSNHEGHEITFHRTAPGGCCDCGDSEAWAPSGFCCNHGPHEDDGDPRAALPDGVARQSKVIISCIFDVIVNALEEIFKSYTRCLDDVDCPPPEDDTSTPGSVTVILNNDDIHSYETVKFALRALRMHVQLDQSTIVSKTQTVDEHGRAPVFTKGFTDPVSFAAASKTAKSIRESLEQHGLLVSVSLNKQQTFERRAIAGIVCLCELVKVSQGLLLNLVDEFMNKKRVVDCTRAEAYLTKRCSRNFWPSTSCPPHQSVVQAILNYDSLMPKQFIKSVQGLWLSLLTNVEFKNMLGSCFMNAHVRIASAYSAGIGTSAETCIMLAVQLLTVPSVVESLEQQSKARGSDLVVELLTTLRHFMWSCCVRDAKKTGSVIDSARRGRMVLTNALDFSNSSIEHQRYAQFIHNAIYIFRLIKQALVEPEQRLVEFIRFLKCCQRANEQERYMGRFHVEHEDDNWIKAFNLSLTLNTITRPVAIELGQDMATLYHNCSGAERTTVGRDILRRIGEMCFDACFSWRKGELIAVPTIGNQLAFVEQVWVDDDKTVLSIRDSGEISRASSPNLRYPTKVVGGFTVVEADVRKGDIVSHHLPIQRFFSTFVLSFAGGVDRKTDDRSGYLDGMLQLALTDKVDMIQFAEDILRVFAANAQINAQMWRKNGYTMDNIVVNYKGLCGPFMYQADVAFIQIVISAVGAEHIMTALLDKFQLYSFFMNNDESSQPEDHDIHLADELLRLVAHIVAEIQTSKNRTRSALRREIVHAIAQSDSSKCTFSKIVSAVRSARLPYSSGNSETEGGEHENADDAMDDDDEGMGSVPTADIEQMLEQVAVKNSMENSTTWTYSLKPEVWCHEVDPFYWNVARQREEVVSERLVRAHKDRLKRSQNAGPISFPMVGTPPGPPVSLLSRARNIIGSTAVLNWLVHPVMYSALAANAIDIVGLPSEEQQATAVEDPKHKVRVFTPEEKAKFSGKVSLGLAHSAIHLFTLFVHFLETQSGSTSGLHPDFDRVLTNCSTFGFSLLEVAVNLESLYTSEGNEEKLIYMRWCNDQVSKWYPDDILYLRTQLNLIGMTGKGKRKSKDSRKKKKKKKSRGDEAQRLVMERMKQAQAKVLQNFANDETSAAIFGEEGACLEENYCVLCHEHIEKLPYAFLGYARTSSWGNDLPLAVHNERCPPGVLTGKRKPAGWWSEEKIRHNSLTTTNSSFNASTLGAAGAGAGAAVPPVPPPATRGNGNNQAADDAPTNTTSAGGSSTGATSQQQQHVDDQQLDWTMSSIQGNNDNNGDDEEDGDVMDEEEFYDLLEGGVENDAAGTGATGSSPVLSRSRNSTGEVEEHVMSAITSQIQGMVDDLVLRQIMSILSHSGHRESPQLVAPDTKQNVFVSFCSHAMHMECLHKYIESLKQDRQAGLSFLRRRSLPDITNNELFCPMCKSLSNIIVPFVRTKHSSTGTMARTDSNDEVMSVEGQQMEKRRRLSSATPDEMARFISGEELLGKVQSQPGEGARSSKEIEHLIEGIVKVELAGASHVEDGGANSDDGAAGAKCRTENEQMVSLWKTLAFSISAREAVHRTTCGVPATYSASSPHNGFRELLESVATEKKQWHALFQAATILSMNGNFKDAEEGSENSAASQSSSSSSSASASTSGGSFGKSLLRSPFSMFLNSFRKSSSSLASTSSSSSSGQVADQQQQLPDEPGPKIEETGNSAVTRALFQILTTGYCDPALSSFAKLLAPAARIGLFLQFDENILKAAGKRQRLRTDLMCNDVDKNPVQVYAGDEIVYIASHLQSMTVERQICTDGLLLNIEDPVVLLVGLMSCLPPSLYCSAARAIALATLIQSVMTVEKVELCASSFQNETRMAIAERWLEPLRTIVPTITVKHVYSALFGKLSRFLRCSVILIYIASDHNKATNFADFEVYYSEEVEEEVEILWLRFLGLPPMHVIVQSENMMKIISRWKTAFIAGRHASASPSSLSLREFGACCLERTRVGLISLPKNYEQLLAHVSRVVKCPTTGKPIKNPALCLRCGLVVCAKQNCCRRSGVGPGTLHARSCGGGSCAFLLVQKCVVVLVHGKYFIETSAPYVDSHGETDDYLRRGRPLTFHEQSYKNLQYICANNQICDKVVSAIQMNEYSRHLIHANVF